MKHHNVASGGAALKVVDHHVVALYEATTGTIRHVHEVTVFEGGRAVNEQEAVGRAKQNASKAGLKTEHLEVKVSKNPDHARRPHRIDPKTREFVALEGTRKRG